MHTPQLMPWGAPDQTAADRTCLGQFGNAVGDTLYSGWEGITTLLGFDAATFDPDRPWREQRDPARSGQAVAGMVDVAVSLAATVTIGLAVVLTPAEQRARLLSDWGVDPEWLRERIQTAGAVVEGLTGLDLDGARDGGSLFQNYRDDPVRTWTTTGLNALGLAIPTGTTPALTRALTTVGLHLGRFTDHALATTLTAATRLDTATRRLLNTAHHHTTTTLTHLTHHLTDALDALRTPNHLALAGHPHTSSSSHHTGNGTGGHTLYTTSHHTTSGSNHGSSDHGGPARGSTTTPDASSGRSGAAERASVAGAGPEPVTRGTAPADPTRQSEPAPSTATDTDTDTDAHAVDGRVEHGDPTIDPDSPISPEDQRAIRHKQRLLDRRNPDGSYVFDGYERNFLEGQIFDHENNHRYPYNQFTLTREDSYLTENGTWANPHPRRGAHVRVDSYDPARREIVERKYTQIADIQLSSWNHYLYQLTNDYRAYDKDIIIPDTPGNREKFGPGAPEIGGSLEGEYIMEVPVQHRPPPADHLRAADDKDVTVRDVEETVWSLSDDGTQIIETRADGTITRHPSEE